MQQTFLRLGEKMLKKIKNNWLSYILIIGTTGWAFTQIDSLPDLIPSHFNIHGSPDEYGDKYINIVLLPLINLFTILFLSFSSKVSPKNYEMNNSQNLIKIFNLGITVFLMAVYLGVILEAKFPLSGAFANIIIPALAIFMIFIGNYFGKLERNFFIGIRIPWTISSEVNWLKTHRFAGKIFVTGGLLLFMISLFKLPIWYGFLVLIMALVASIVFSLYYFLRFERQT